MSRWKLRAVQVLLLVTIFAVWQVLTQPGLVPPFVWDNPDRAAFFFGEPVKMFQAIWTWFAEGSIYKHLWVDARGDGARVRDRLGAGARGGALARALGDAPRRCSIPTSPR